MPSHPIIFIQTVKDETHVYVIVLLRKSDVTKKLGPTKWRINVAFAEATTPTAARSKERSLELPKKLVGDMLHLNESQSPMLVIFFYAPVLSLCFSMSTFLHYVEECLNTIQECGLPVKHI